MLAAAEALAAVVHPDELNPAYIVPSVFHPDVTKVVAAAVRAAAEKRRGGSPSGEQESALGDGRPDPVLPVGGA